MQTRTSVIIIVALLLLAGKICAQDRRFLIDFGNPAMTTSLTGWNNVTNSVAGTTVNLITSNGAPSTINIEIVNSSDDGYDGAGNQFNAQGYNGQVLDYPASACNDSHFSYLTGGVYKLTGLQTDRFYTIRIFGSRSITASDRVGTYTFNQKQKQLNASNNSSQTVIFHYLKPSAQGELILDFGVAQGSQFGYLNVMDVTETATPAIIAPGNLTAQTSNTDVVLNWTDNSNNESGFRIERRLTSQNLFQVAAEVGANVTQFTDADVVPGNYEYRVFAYNGTHESAYSNEVTILVTEPVVGERRFLIDFGNPDMQTSISGWNNVISSFTGTTVPLVTTQGNTSAISLVIVNNADNGYGGNGNQFNSGGYNGTVLDYPQSACIDSHYSYLTGGTYKLTGLNPAKFYTIRLFGSRAAAGNDRSATYTFNGKQLILDAAGNTSQTVSFYYLKPTLEGELVMDFGVAAGSTFGYLNVMDVTERETPAINSPLNLQGTKNGVTVTLNWTDNSSNELGFSIERRVAGDALFTEVGQVAAGVTQFTEMVTTDATVYEYRVFAYKADENSPYSHTVSVGSLPSEPPAAPTSLQFFQNGETVYLSWDNPSSASGVKIERRIFDGTGLPFTPVGEVGPGVSEFVDTPTPQNESFEYRIYAWNAIGNSPYSNSVFVESLAPPQSNEFIVLSSLYDRLNGKNWHRKHNWPSYDNWPQSATMAQMSTWEGVMINGNSLNAITLRNNNLRGELPEDLWTLSDLWFIRMRDNAITGFASSEYVSFTQMYNLYEIDLANNRITWLPLDFGSLPAINWLSLEGNQLTELPASFSYLTTLYELNLRNNKLMYLPDFSEMPLSTVDVSYNYLGFSSLEPLVQQQTITSLTYTPQKDIPGDVYTVSEGDYMVLYPHGYTPNCTVVWEKRQSDGTWADVSHLNEDQSQETFTREIATATDEGSYRWRMTNSIVTGITIQSEPIQVQFYLAADNSKVKRLYNGVITAMRWRTDKADEYAEDLQGLYYFTYDDKYQITDARWKDRIGGIYTILPDNDNKFRLTGLRYDPNGNILSLKRFDENAVFKDNFNYYYSYQRPEPGAVMNNQLTSVDGYVNKFSYNKIGQMVAQDKEDAMPATEYEGRIYDDLYVEYDVSGKVRKVFSSRDPVTDELKDIKVEYLYDDRGFRMAKINHETNSTTWYIRDASGNTISVYEQDGLPETPVQWHSTSNIYLTDDNHLILMGTPASARSAQRLKSAKEGYFEYAIENLNGNISLGVVGISSGKACRLQLNPSTSTVTVTHNFTGSPISQFPYNTGNTLKIARENNEVYIYLDNILRGSFTFDTDHGEDLELEAQLSGGSPLPQGHGISGVRFVGGTEITQAEVPIYGSGKLGTHYPDQNSATVYEITDHLGNVRALMRDNTVTYVATMEDTEELNFTNPRVEEMQYFENLFKTADENIAMNHTPPGAVEIPDKAAYLYWVDGMANMEAADKAIGPAISLKVRPGDVLEIETWAKFERKLSYNRDIVLSSLAGLLGNAFAPQVASEGYSAVELASNINSALINFQYPNDGSDDEVPFAYLNYVLFDEWMNFIDAGWKRVSDAAGFDPPESGLPGGHEHLKLDAPITVTQKGYIYIWVSNQSEATRLWFDDLTVKISGSFVTQSTDYGVWGDVLREQKVDERQYRFGYQGQFSERDLETGLNSFQLRSYDPIIARWTSTDPYGQYYSPYLGMGNNSVSGVDPDGGYSKAGAWWRSAFGLRGEIYQSGYTEDGSREVWGFNTTDGVSHFGSEDIGTFWNGSNDVYQGDFNRELAGGWTDWVGVGLDAGDDVMSKVGSNFQALQAESNALRWGLNYSKEIGKVSVTTTALKWAGRGLAVYNARDVYLKYQSGQIGTSSLILEQGTNVFSTFGGVHGAAWSIGWETGRAITTIPAYQTWKHNTWLPFRQQTLGY